MAKSSGRRGRPAKHGKRTASGRISRAGARIVKGSLGTRLIHARGLLGADDRTRLEMLCTVSPAQLLLAEEIELAKDETAEDAVHFERERLFLKAERAANALQRRDPIGRAWHEGLLDRQGVDPEVLRDLGREFGFLYWHEYREVDATVGGYSDMVALGSVRLCSAGRDTLGAMWKAYSRIVDEMPKPVRPALDRLCVNDMWFAEGPDWLDRIINTARVLREPRSVVGELARKGDQEILRLAISALVAIARGGAARIVEPTIVSSRDGVVEHQVVMPIEIDPRFIDKRGFMRSWEQVKEIILGADPEEIDAREEKAA